MPLKITPFVERPELATVIPGKEEKFHINKQWQMFGRFVREVLFFYQIGAKDQFHRIKCVVHVLSQFDQLNYASSIKKNTIQ